MATRVVKVTWQGAWHCFGCSSPHETLLYSFAWPNVDVRACVHVAAVAFFFVEGVGEEHRTFLLLSVGSFSCREAKFIRPVGSL